MLSRLLRPIIAGLFTPLAKLLMRIGVTPDFITIAGTIITSLLALWLIPNGHLFWGGFWIGVFALFDSLDGVLARMSGRSGPWGAFLDSTLDRITDGAIFGAIILYFMRRIYVGGAGAFGLPVSFPISISSSAWVWPWQLLMDAHPLNTASDAQVMAVLDSWIAMAALACLALGAVVPYARARAGAFGVDAKSGLFERPARLLLALVPLGFVQFGLSPWVLFIALTILAIGSFITVLQRMLEVRRALAGVYYDNDGNVIAPAGMDVTGLNVPLGGSAIRRGESAPPSDSSK